MSLPLNKTDEYDWNGLRDEVIALKARGCSVEYIARLKGKDPKTITRILKTDFQERYGKRQEIVEAHAIELEWMKKKALERLHSAGDKWDRRDAELYLKIRAEQARLFGTDQPAQHQHQVTVELAELPDEEVINQLRQFGVSLPAGFLSLPPAKPDVIDAELTSAETNAPAEQDRRS